MWNWLLAQTDNLTLPGYGICGIVIAGLSRYCWILDARCNRLQDAAVARERETADTTIPLLVKAIDVLASAAPHIDRVSDRSQENEVVSFVKRLDSLVSDLEKREKRLGG